MTHLKPSTATHAKLYDFLAEHNNELFDKSKPKSSKGKWRMNADLATALVVRLGGVEDFLATYENIHEHEADGFRGFTTLRDQVEFFDDNKADLIDYVKRCADKEDVSSAIELISHWSMGNGFVNMDVVAHALYENTDTVGEKANTSNKICAGIALSAVASLCEGFMTYLVDRAEINAIKAPTMKATQSHLDDFIATHQTGLVDRYQITLAKWDMNRELACALVERLDKNGDFLDNYSDVLHKEDHNLNGFYFADDALGFFDDNKVNLLDSVMRRANKDVLAESVLEVILASIDDAPEIDIDQVAKALYEPAGEYKYASCARSIVCMSIARKAAAELCTNFVKFMLIESAK